MMMNHMQLFAPIAHGMVAGLSSGGMKTMLVLALPSAGVAPFLVRFRSRVISIAAAAHVAGVLSYF